MPGFSKQIPHACTQEEALSRLQDFVAGVKRKYGELASEVQGEWVENMLDFSVTAMGLRIQGKLVVQTFLADIDVKYPFAAALFAGRIEETITRELQQVLA
jgi:hypothetical protein